MLSMSRIKRLQEAPQKHTFESNIPTNLPYMTVKKKSRVERHSLCGSIGFKSWRRPGQTFYHSMHKADICEILQKKITKKHLWRMRRHPLLERVKLAKLAKAKWNNLCLSAILRHRVKSNTVYSHLAFNKVTWPHRERGANGALVNWVMCYLCHAQFKSSLNREDTPHKFSYGPYEQVRKAPIFPLY